MMKLLNPKRRAKNVLDQELINIAEKVNEGYCLTEEETKLVLQVAQLEGNGVNWDAVKVLGTLGVSLIGLYLISKKEETELINQKAFSLWTKMIGH